MPGERGTRETGPQGLPLRLRGLLTGAGWETVKPDRGRRRFYRATLPRSAPVRRPRPGIPVAVDLDRVTSTQTFSFRSGGWHPYVATLRRRQGHSGLTYRESALFLVHAGFRPRCLADVVFVDPDPPTSPLDRLPALRGLAHHLWALREGDVARAMAGPSPRRIPKSQHFGPVPEQFGRAQLDRLVRTYRSIAEHGYRPTEFPGGVATGYFLVDGGDWRFVLRQGHHRAAALRALGHARLVATPITALAVVDGQRLEPFTTDAGGLYSPTAAERLFRSQFDEDGTRRAARLGIEGAVRPA